MRAWVGRILALVFVSLTVVGCTSGSTPRSSGATSGGPVSSVGATPSSSSAPGPAQSPSSSATADGAILRPIASRLTPEGLWWAVDSTVAVNDDSLSNVHHYYRASHNPVAWGRYVSGSFAVHPAELDFAARHHIALYFLVPDDNCSGCGGGDACGNDRTPGQARHDAMQAIKAAKRLKLPAGVALFKDLEQVGACDGELTGTYILAWFHRVRRSPYRPAFYGNTTAQSFDFPRAFCAAVHREPDFLPNIVLAQDEPEPAIGAPAKTIGPDNAPHFKPKHPFCTTRAATSIWQYGESLSDDNLTDVDEIRPNTPGLLAPGGSVTR